MSAYDNPTIIKDDSAMIYAQMLGTLGQTFTESFNVARKEREAKEKEARLEAEKRAKESDQLLINIQRTTAEIQNANAIDLNKTVGALPKELGTTLTTQFSNSILEFGEVFGKAATKNDTTVVGEDVKSVLSKKPIYLQTRQNVINTFGAITSQVNSYGEDFKGDGSDVSIVGTNPIERMTNFYTMQGLNPKNAMSSNVTKNFTWDKEDPSKATLAVSTKFNSKNELMQALGKWTPGSKPEDLDKMIASAGKSITANEDGTYSLNFEKQIGDGNYDGMFYTKVPPVLSGDEFKNANIVDEKNQFSTKYLGDTTNISAKGYDSKKPGVKGYWQGTEIDMKAAKNDLRPVVQARMEGLLNADFRDTNVLQGFLTNKLKLGTDDIALILNAQDYNTKVNLLTNQAMEVEIANKLGNQLHQIGDKYYLGDKDRIQDINLNPKGGSSSSPASSSKSQDAFNERIRNVIKTKKGGVSKGGYTLMIKDGRWGLYDKDGLEKVGTEDITDPSVLATFIGGTLDQ